MVSIVSLLDLIESVLNRRKILDAAAVGMPTPNQHQAYRKIVLNEFGNQGFLPELEALLQQQGQDRNGQAKTAGKEVPR